MRFINNAHFIPGEDDDTSDVMPVARPFNVMFEEQRILRGDKSMYETAKKFSEESFKEGGKRFIDYSTDYNIE